MLIEKSPFYPTNNKIKKIDFDKKINFKVKEDDSKTDKETKGSFNIIKWIKGVINPLQNLPIISGVYSSINSEDAESDRDMVQNGLGGFLYGGPIGAIAGVGNWVFNKIFKNTPTEMFFSVTGISNLWKGKPEEEKKIVSETKDLKNIQTNNLTDKITMKSKVSPRLDSQGTVNKNNTENDKILSQKNHTLMNSVINKNLEDSKSKEKIIEFNYPKWEPTHKEYLDNKNKNLNLSMIKSIYSNMNSKKPNNIEIKA